MKTTLILLSFFFLSSYTVKGQLHYGAGGQFNLNEAAVGIQGKLFYEIDETYRASGTFTLHFDNLLNWTIDIDGHYKVLELFDDFNFAPIAGLAVTDTDAGNRIGLNLGAFMDLEINDRFFYLEPKFTFRNGTALIFSGGVYF